VLILRQAKVGKSHRIEIVVAERDEAKSQPSQLDDFFNYDVGGALTGPLTIGSPNRAEGAVLWAAAHGLN
jgi:hypothetical protein